MTEQLTAEQKLAQLIELKQKVAEGGGLKGIERQHARGKLTARERVDLLQRARRAAAGAAPRAPPRQA